MFTIYLLFPLKLGPSWQAAVAGNQEVASAGVAAALEADSVTGEAASKAALEAAVAAANGPEKLRGAARGEAARGEAAPKSKKKNKKETSLVGTASKALSILLLSP